MDKTQWKLPRREKAALIWRFLKPVVGFFVAALLSACLSMAFNALTPQIVKVTVDNILGSKAPEATDFFTRLLPLEQLRKNPAQSLLYAALAVMAVAVLRGVCSFGQRYYLGRGSEGFVKGIRDGLFGHIQRLSFAWHKAHSTGDMIQRCTSDVDVIRSFVCNQLVEVVRTVFLIVLYLTIMFSMNVRLSLISLAFIPIVGLSSGVFYRKISSRFQAADEAEGELTTCAQENLTGVRVVRAFGREKFEVGRTRPRASSPPAPRKTSPACGWCGHSAGRSLKLSGSMKKTSGFPPCGSSLASCSPSIGRRAPSSRASR